MGVRYTQMRRADWAMGKAFRGWIARAQGGLCAACGQHINVAKNTHPFHADALTMDHVFPRSEGGSRDLGNVVAMHRKCNGRKGSRAPTGCEVIWLHLVNAKIAADAGVSRAYRRPNAIATAVRSIETRSRLGPQGRQSVIAQSPSQ